MTEGQGEADPATCPTCGLEITEPDRLLQHLNGLDASRLECARQDLEAIAAAARPNPYSRALRSLRW